MQIACQTMLVRYFLFLRGGLARPMQKACQTMLATIKNVLGNVENGDVVHIFNISQHIFNSSQHSLARFLHRPCQTSINSRKKHIRKAILARYLYRNKTKNNLLRFIKTKNLHIAHKVTTFAISKLKH